MVIEDTQVFIKEWEERKKLMEKEKKAYHIELDLSDIYGNKNLEASGYTKEEMIEDANILLTDNDGGELDCYGVDEFTEGEYKILMEAIDEEMGGDQ